MLGAVNLILFLVASLQLVSNNNASLQVNTVVVFQGLGALYCLVWVVTVETVPYSLAMKPFFGRWTPLFDLVTLSVFSVCVTATPSATVDVVNYVFAAFPHITFAKGIVDLTVHFACVLRESCLQSSPLSVRLLAAFRMPCDCYAWKGALIAAASKVSVVSSMCVAVALGGQAVGRGFPWDVRLGHCVLPVERCTCLRRLLEPPSLAGHL